MKRNATYWLAALGLAASPVLVVAGPANAQCCPGCPSHRMPMPPERPHQDRPRDSSAPQRERGAKFTGDPYPLDTCPISDEKLGSMGEPIIKTYDAPGGGAREVRFCCDACPAEFETDLAESFAKLDEVIIKDQLPHYPLETSVVSGEVLGGQPIDWVCKNRLFRLANESEKAEVREHPKKHFAALDMAVIAAQSDKYPLDTCLVDGMKLGSMGRRASGGPVQFVTANRLFRLCAESERAQFNNDPAIYLAKLDQAWKDKGGGSGLEPAPGNRPGVKQPQPSPPKTPATVYTCPMHTDVRQQSPGTCPKCGMDLVRK